MTLNEFRQKLNCYIGLNYDRDVLPCFSHRYSVPDVAWTPALIKEYIQVASTDSKNDVLVFSVTERDKLAWKVWAAYAKTHPRTFKMVQGGSIHGVYQCRMYIYTKPKSKRKYG